MQLTSKKDQPPTRHWNVTYIIETSGAAEDELVAVGLQDRAVNVGLHLLVDEDADGLEAGSALKDLLRDSMVSSRYLVK